MILAEHILAVPVQFAQSGSPTTAILGWVLGLIIILVIGGLVIFAFRRRMLAKNNPVGYESGLMDQMRAMHEQGVLSKDEYDRIRKRLAAKVAGKDPDSVVLIDPEFKAGSSDPSAGGVLRAKEGFDLAGDPLPGRLNRGGDPENSPGPRGSGGSE